MGSRALGGWRQRAPGRSSFEARLNAALTEVEDVYRPEVYRPAGYGVGGGVSEVASPRLPVRAGAPAEVRVECGNPACSGSWMRRWKDRRRPIFERQWGCSSRCMKAMVQAAVRREAGAAEVRASEATVEGQHRHRVPLGLVLLAQGWITHPQLRQALEVQRQAGTGRIGYWLTREFGIKEEFITQALGVQWSCPVLPMTGFDPEAMALAMPQMLVEKLGLLPLRVAGKRTLYLGFADEMDAAAAFALERMSGMRVQSGVMGETHWRSGRTRLLASDFVEARMEPAADTRVVSTKLAAALNEMQPKASRLVRVHQFYWMRMWLESGAMQGAVDGEGGIPLTKEDVVDRVYAVGE